MSSSTQRLGQGFLHCRVSLAAGDRLAGSRDDLLESSCAFKAPPAQAKRNALRVRPLAGRP
eukprot:9169167-Pyramimonas_sp.AAC.1